LKGAKGVREEMGIKNGDKYIFPRRENVLIPIFNPHFFPDPFSQTRLSPVISAGCASPSTFSMVGARSQSRPPFRSRAPRKLSPIATNGTGLVVWYVCGAPVA